MVSLTSAERKAAERARKRAEGLVLIQVWAHPKDHPAIKRYVERLAKRKSKV